MEALFDWKGDHHPYQPSTIVVFTVTIKVATVMTFQMDGFSTTISFGYWV